MTLSLLKFSQMLFDTFYFGFQVVKILFHLRNPLFPGREPPAPVPEVAASACMVFHSAVSVTGVVPAAVTGIVMMSATVSLHTVHCTSVNI
jgi:hypothetical protein